MKKPNYPKFYIEDLKHIIGIDPRIAHCVDLHLPMNKQLIEIKKNVRFVVKITTEGDGILEMIKKGNKARLKRVDKEEFRNKKLAINFLLDNGFEKAELNTNDGIKEFWIKKKGVWAVIEKQVPLLNIEYDVE